MISSPDSILQSSTANNSDVMQKILSIRQELGIIGKHEREHITDAGEIVRFDEACRYCKRRSTDDEVRLVDRPQKKNVAGTVNELERTVEGSGKTAHVIVPRSWTGKRVKIIVVEE